MNPVSQVTYTIYQTRPSMMYQNHVRKNIIFIGVKKSREDFHLKVKNKFKKLTKSLQLLAYEMTVSLPLVCEDKKKLGDAGRL